MLSTYFPAAPNKSYILANDGEYKDTDVISHHSQSVPCVLPVENCLVLCCSTQSIDEACYFHLLRC